MAWFTIQSIPLILLSFALGLLVGWLWWGRQVRRIRTDEEGHDGDRARPGGNRTAYHADQG